MSELGAKLRVWKKATLLLASWQEKALIMRRAPGEKTRIPTTVTNLSPKTDLEPP